MEWFCNTESHPSFAESKDFLEHMHAVHLEPLDETQLLSLHRGFQRPSNTHSGTCTLCGQHANQLKSHLARHLEQVALFAIPQTDYMNLLEENDTSSNAARQSVPALSSIGSTRIASDPAKYDSGSEASVSRSGSFNQKMRSSRAAADEQYTDQDVELPLTTSGDAREEVDTSWDQITAKFKDARIGMYNNQSADIYERQPMATIVATDEGSVDTRPREQRYPLQKAWKKTRPPDNTPTSGRSLVSVIHSLHHVEPAPISRHPPSIRERASRITSNLFSPFRSSKALNSKEEFSVSRSPRRHNEEELRPFPEVPGEIRRNSDSEQTSSEPWRPLRPSEDDDYSGLEIVNIEPRRTWRQRLSKAIGIGHEPEPSGLYPTRAYLYDPSKDA